MSFGSQLLKISPYLPWKISYPLRSFLGVIPDFFILGFPKCGTTSLYNYLIQHPQVMDADGKEQWYFSTFPIKSIDYYKFNYPYRFDRFLSNIGLRSSFQLGDGTPDYIFRETSIKQIKKTAPNSKIVVLVRNPIDRSYSYFKHETRAGRIVRSFQDLIQYEYNLFKEKGILCHEDMYEHPQLKDTFLLGSLYSEYLETLLKYYQRDEILLIASEKLFSDPKTVFDDVLEFLNLGGDYNVDFRVFNSGNYDIDKNPESDFLQTFYAPYNKKLYDMFDIDLGW